MKQKRLALCLKVCTVIIALAAGLILLVILPNQAAWCLEVCPEFQWLTIPTYILVCGSYLPCLGALVAFYRICMEIGRDNSFCRENVRRLLFIAGCAVTGILLCVTQAVLMAAAQALHPGVLLLCLLICLFGITVAAAAAILSHLVEKACDLREDHDLTV